MNVYRQRGLSLLEAMVSALLFSIVFLGLAYVLSRGLVSQRNMNVQSLALLEVREQLQVSDGIALFCESPPSIEGVSYTVDCDSVSGVRIQFSE